MKPGRESQTAVMVCAARALAHGRTSVAKFSDPTALALLPEEARAQVEHARAGVAASGMRERMAREFLAKRSSMMVARTVAVDEAVRSANTPQLVILGAGLDGRAWRMPELREVAVFEVDHPDSQREKQRRAAVLQPLARKLCFVPVDFTRDRLDDALEAAGHEPAHATTWIWEGVVMYLDQSEIEAALAVIRRRSAPGSRLIIVYVSPTALRWLAALLLWRMGEPLRSVFTASQLRHLLARYGFAVTEDDSVHEIGAALAADVGRATRALRHLRVAVAERERG
jgi:methyltransferase (TIGR00027 family)